QVVSAACGATRPPRMPLIPAMRPWNSIKMTAASPMSAPPASAEYGVKFCMRLLPGSADDRQKPGAGQCVGVSPGAQGKSVPTSGTGTLRLEQTGSVRSGNHRVFDGQHEGNDPLMRLE